MADIIIIIIVPNVCILHVLCMCYTNAPDHLEHVRTPTLSSVLLSIACANVARMLLESVRMSVYYL